MDTCLPDALVGVQPRRLRGARMLGRLYARASARQRLGRSGRRLAYASRARLNAGTCA